jgi:uncharacterized repeat protein (TIGR02543 family)
MRENNMKKTAARISALFMAVCLTFTYAGPLQVNASGPGLSKDSTGAYLISSADDLNTFADWVNDGNDCDDDTIKLTTDIIARDDFPMIGQYGFWSNDYFSGTFDGQGHAITVNINSDNNFVGLFGCISEASIKNLTLNGSVVGDNDTSYQSNATGGICAFVTSFSDDGGVPFKNCVNNASVTGYGKVGGIVGDNTTKGDYDNVYSCVNCTNNGNITALEDADCGGIMGEGGYCIDCVNTGNITGDDSFAGGIVGKGARVQIHTCQNRGTVFSNNAAGGIVGYENGLSKYYGCSNLGAVRSTGNYFGGIVGLSDFYIVHTEAEIHYCYNLADLGSVSPHYADVDGYGYGGLVGGAKTLKIIKFDYCYTINGTSPNQNAIASDFIGISAGMSASIRYDGCFTLSEHSDIPDVTALSEEQFSVGEACYLLNRRITYDGFTDWTTYHQTLNDTVTSTGIKQKDAYPNLSASSYIVVKESDWTYCNTDSNKVLTGTASNGTVKVQALSNGVYVDVAGRHIEKGTTVRLTATPNTYCNLTGWTEQTAAGQTAVTYVRTGNSITFTMPDRDVKFTPVFERQKYTVTFNANNGTGTMGTQEFEYGIAEKLTASTFTRPGYTFLGWSTKNNTEAAAYSDQQSITKISSDSTVKNVTLYAAWKADADAYLTYTSADANMGTTSRIYDNCTHGLESDPSITAVTAEPSTGYHFVKWYDYTNKQDISTDATLSSALIKAQAYNDSIYKTTAFVAYFEANRYTVIFDKGAEAAVGTMEDQTLTYGKEENLTANAFTYTNHIFVGWATETGGDPVYINAQSVECLSSGKDATVTLYAVWASSSDVVLSYAAADAARGSVSAAAERLLASGEAKGSTATAKTGYSFVNWTDKDGKEVGTLVKYVPENSGGDYVTAAYTANFKANTYKVVFDDDVDDNSVSGMMADQTLTYGTETNLNTNGFTRKGYVFGGWYVEGVTPVQLYKDGASVMNLDSDQGATVTLKAVWTKLPDAEMSYSSGNEENGNVSTAAEIVDPYGKPAGASASAADGYHFVNWTDANGKEVSKEASYIPTAADYYVTASYTANFEANTYAIVFNANEGADSMDDQIMTYDKTEKLAANTITRPGYAFTGWNTSSDGTGTAYDDETSILNLTEEQGAKIDLYAQWTSLSDITTTYISANRTMGKTLRAYDAINPETGVPAGSAAEAKTGYRFVSWTYDDQVVTTNAKLTTAQVAANAKKNDGYVTGVFTANFEAVKGTDDTHGDNDNSNQDDTNIVVDDGYAVPDTSVK